jgi:hypothetical protein
MNPLSHLPNQINWTLVAACLAHNLTSPEEQKTWIIQEKSEMEKRLQLMLDLDLPDLKTNHWHFIRLPPTPENTISFQLIFTPIDIILTLKDQALGTLERMEDTERQTLQNLALKYTNEGKYLELKRVTQRLSEIITLKK